MYISNRLKLATFCLSFAAITITACNPVPLSVVASDFSINGVKGTSTSTSTGSSSTVTGTTTDTSTNTSSSANKSTAATTGTGATSGATITTGATTGTASSAEQSVTIDLTSKEACTDFTKLVAKVVLDEGVKISPDPAVARDYTSPVTFTVTESYGTKVVYTLTVKGKACAATAKLPDARGTVPLTCTPAAIGKTGYSLVFKACDANDEATYYDETACVRDNQSGLIWEGKTLLGLRAGDEKYNNLDSTSLLQIPANNVPSPALPARAPTQAEIDSPNNSIGYKNTVNALKLCGAGNWRMPTKEELQGIRTTGSTSGTTTQIDLTWFPNTNLNGYYATSTPFGTQAELSSVVQFGAGTVDNWLRDGTVWDATKGVALPLRENSVRLVRSAF